MPLNLYRRHRPECEAGRPAESRSGEFEERKKGWKRCACFIFASGTLGGKFKRKYTGKTDWDEATAIAAAWEKTNSWDGTPVLPPAPTSSLGPGRVTLAEAVKVFLRNREGANIAAATLRQYKTFTKRLTVFADSHGYVMLDQITAGDVDAFYGEWKLGARTKGKRLGTLRAFFRFCMNRKWLRENPVSPDMKPPIGANRVANKAPFSDEELQRIMAACDGLSETAWTNGSEQGVWAGEDVKDFIWVMAHTGLRISDVGLFNMNRLRGNEVFLRAKKNGGEVFAYIPDWLRDRLKTRAKRCGPRPFVVGRSDRLETVTDLWRRKINRVFELAGRFEEPPTPHRFRHTFARILLQRGVPVADVADLLGDDEKTVREHYSRWVPERQARLTKILKEAFEDQPKPTLVAPPSRNIAGGL
jgi:integrase/recombinase XerC